MTRYVVVWPVKAGGRRREPGETVELPEAEAARAMAGGFLAAEPRETTDGEKKPKGQKGSKGKKG